MYFKTLYYIYLSMKKNYLILVFVFCSTYLRAQTITLEAFGPTFNNPVSIKNAGDNRLFIVDQQGFIRILNPDGTTPTTPFLDIDALVYDDIANFWERGLLGLVFHPNYASNGYFYVNYIDQNGDSIVSRFTVSNSDSNVADPNSELLILKLVQPYDAHNGGDMAFDSNGYLYLAFGDGGTTLGDPDNRSQNLNLMWGKILRIDVDNPANGKNYGIPASNPFANDGDPNTLAEIWAYGLRNPAKFSFDSLTGDIWIADTGQDENEEIDLDIGNTGGHNYGWRCYEAFDEFNIVGCPDISTMTFPVNEYNHFEPDGIFRCAVIGGYRYRGSAQSNLYGTYFFADWCSNEIFMLTENAGTWTRTAYMPTIPNQRWTGFGEDVNGELYIIGNFGPGGGVGSKVYKIKQNTLSNNPIESELGFSISPNPTSNSKIRLILSDNTSLKDVNAYNLSGQKIKMNITNRNSNTINIEFSELLSSGMYIIEVISTNGEKFQNKIIIQ